MFIIIVFFIFTHKVNANLEITEVMYNSKDADVDWIEIHNPDGGDVDISKIKLLISNSESNHGIVGYNGSQYLKNGEYGVIVVGSQLSGFISRWTDIKNLFTSSFSLPNLKEGESALIEINYGDKLSPIDSFSYDNSKGASDNGNSLQLIDNVWKESLPTPGESNFFNSNENTQNNLDDTNNDSASVNSSSNSSSTKSEPEILYSIKTKIITPKIVTEGIPFSINHETFGVKKEKVILGRFVWNFGDGMTKEFSVSPEFDYIYQYEGEYVLTLSFYDSVFSITPDAVDRVVVKVIPSGIEISSVGGLSDPYIEIENNSKYEISLHGWVIKGNFHSFVIPEGMVILPNKKLKLSPKITGFDFSDLSNISIIDLSGQVFAAYPKQKVITSKYYSNKNSQTNIVKSEVVENNNIENFSNVINLNDLGASAVSSDNKNLSKGFYIWIGLAFIIIIGLVSIILIRRRKEEYPDYVERKLTANDMTIIE